MESNYLYLSFYTSLRQTTTIFNTFFVIWSARWSVWTITTKATEWQGGWCNRPGWGPSSASSTAMSPARKRRAERRLAKPKTTFWNGFVYNVVVDLEVDKLCFRWPGWATTSFNTLASPISSSVMPPSGTAFSQHRIVRIRNQSVIS